ncbi:MAG: ATP-binding protein [Candidatus Omnitrophica bacterium]|nr:ATP-binding protein [Candidatus Omnitrophota bacterium]
MKYNPFNPNSVVSTNLFAGRKEYVFRILRKLEQVKKGMPASFFLSGERGIGKTALAKLVKHIAESKVPDFGDLALRLKKG